MTGDAILGRVQNMMSESTIMKPNGAEMLEFIGSIIDDADIETLEAILSMVSHVSYCGNGLVRSDSMQVLHGGYSMLRGLIEARKKHLQEVA